MEKSKGSMLTSLLIMVSCLIVILVCAVTIKFCSDTLDVLEGKYVFSRLNNLDRINFSIDVRGVDWSAEATYSDEVPAEYVDYVNEMQEKAEADKESNVNSLGDKLIVLVDNPDYVIPDDVYATITSSVDAQAQTNGRFGYTSLIYALTHVYGDDISAVESITENISSDIFETEDKCVKHYFSDGARCYAIWTPSEYIYIYDCTEEAAANGLL